MAKRGAIGVDISMDVFAVCRHIEGSDARGSERPSSFIMGSALVTEVSARG